VRTRCQNRCSAKRLTHDGFTITSGPQAYRFAPDRRRRIRKSVLFTSFFSPALFPFEFSPNTSSGPHGLFPPRALVPLPPLHLHPHTELLPSTPIRYPKATAKMPMTTRHGGPRVVNANPKVIIKRKVKLVTEQHIL
jgi:hypothetical protein